MGFTRAQLEACRGAVLPDLLPADDLRLLFVGINSSLWSAAAQAPFASPGNRFWSARAAAGITDAVVDASSGLADADASALFARGIGFANLVLRATARADELSAAELREGGERLRALVGSRRPQVVAVLGITAYRTAFRCPRATPGRQPEPFEGAALWVVPNPSGLNAHETVESLASAYAEVAREAGIA